MAGVAPCVGRRKEHRQLVKDRNGSPKLLDAFAVLRLSGGAVERRAVLDV
jgi:hypothetical protein